MGGFIGNLRGVILFFFFLFSFFLSRLFCFYSITVRLENLYSVVPDGRQKWGSTSFFFSKRLDQIHPLDVKNMLTNS